jgi:3-phenylpropionate/trans-cinnamate dioxygenase ferredoxin reductase component
MTEHFVIVGGGQCAAQAVHSLRHQGFAGSITLIGDEPHVPYQRPPLSKKYLAGELPRERLHLRPASFYADKQVTLELGRRAETLDLAARTVELDDSRSIRYDRLLLATGSRVRRLAVPGMELAGVHYLRTIADVDALAPTAKQGAHAVIVGGGYIGLEVAAVLRQRGCLVTVLEAADRLLARVVCSEVSQFYHERHAAAGVTVRCGAQVRAFVGSERLTAVETANGERFECDLAIVGIGIVPNVELARAAGLPCADGIVVDRHARSAEPTVVAAGDCTDQPLDLYDRRVRLESVANAVHQGKIAAGAMLDALTAYSEVPWFWSDQYDLKLQIAGLSTGYDEVAVRGNPQSGSFAAYYLAAGRLIAVDAVNSPHDFMNGKKLVAARVRVSAAQLRDPQTNLAALGD